MIKVSKTNKRLLSDKFITLSIAVIIGFITYQISKQGVQNSISGTITFYYHDFLFIFPTAAISSVLTALFVFLTLKSFLAGLSKKDLQRGCTLIAKDLQVLCLTVITAYAVFYLDLGLMDRNQNGAIAINITKDFNLYFPTVMVMTLSIVWIVFTILINFLAAMSIGSRQQSLEALEKLAVYSSSEAGSDAIKWKR